MISTPRCLLVSLGLALGSTLSGQSILLGKNLFPEGGFDIYGESRIHPSGWSFPDRNDRPWANGFRAEAIAGESDKELRITRPESAGATIVLAKLQLPPKIDRMRVNFRLLAKAITLGEEDPGGNGAGIWVRFYDADHKAIRGGGWVGGLAKMTDAEWQERETVFSVPAAAVQLELSAIFRGASGEVRMDDVEVVPVTMSE